MAQGVKGADMKEMHTLVRRIQIGEQKEIRADGHKPTGIKVAGGATIHDVKKRMPTNKGGGSLNKEVEYSPSY